MILDLRSEELAIELIAGEALQFGAGAFALIAHAVRQLRLNVVGERGEPALDRNVIVHHQPRERFEGRVDGALLSQQTQLNLGLIVFGRERQELLVGVAERLRVGP